ncbi:hypothetical protein [Flagellimonas onchidii]|uniref:hypothetical protein n=1 Tax=Flagellimonas onchidii TaxID=2562684 RepID=UPI0010A69722|nr:hypothetical protein [Allomuricauda onchidii]
MKKNTYILFFMLVLLILSCTKDDTILDNGPNPVNGSNDKESGDEADNNTMSTELNFTVVSKDTDLPPRMGQEMIAFKGEYWFMGGETPQATPREGNTYFNDIWKSKDGLAWLKVTDNAPWPKRSNFNLFVFDGSLWIIGGKSKTVKSNDEWLNDVWKSADGIKWTKVAQHGPWQTRLSPAVGVQGGKMYLIGGHSTTNWHLYQDVWESSNGTNWSKVASISDELLGVEMTSQGIYEQSILSLNNEYFMLGGSLASSFLGFTSVLKSTDLKKWELVIRDTPWKDTNYTSLIDIRPFVYKDNLMVIINNEVNGANKSVLYASKDGRDWKLKNELPSFIDGAVSKFGYLHIPRSLVVKDKILVYGSYKKTLANPWLDDKTHIIQLSAKK